MAKRFRWDGLQWPPTNLTTAATVFVLVDAVAVEFMPATMVSVRGILTFQATSTASNRVVAKLLAIHVNDAGTMTDDITGIDTDEEDIAVRQLWTYSYAQPTVATDNGKKTESVEVVVKTKIALPASGKTLIALVMNAQVTTRSESIGYLRCLLQG